MTCRMCSETILVLRAPKCELPVTPAAAHSHTRDELPCNYAYGMVDLVGCWGGFWTLLRCAPLNTCFLVHPNMVTKFNYTEPTYGT